MIEYFKKKYIFHDVYLLWENPTFENKKKLHQSCWGCHRDKSSHFLEKDIILKTCLNVTKMFEG